MYCGPQTVHQTYRLPELLERTPLPVGDHRPVPKSLPEFCRSQLCTVVHGHAVCNGRDRKKQLKFKNLGVEYPTNQGVVGSSPAGRAKNQRVGSENQVLLPPVGPLWDLLSTG